MKRALVLSLFVSFLLMSTPVFAASPATSKCVTKATKATHATVVARMQKDVAPYATNPAAASAVKQYQDSIETAWTAMEDMYCGYGSYGAKSAIKSYGKSNERARAAFVAAVKDMKKGSVTMAAASVPSQSAVESPVIVTPSPAKVAVQAKTQTASHVVSGLHRGMESDDVLVMQKVLATHFGLSTDGLATGYFGPKTEKLVVKFQLEQQLLKSSDAPGAGLVGPRTAAALNAL